MAKLVDAEGNECIDGVIKHLQAWRAYIETKPLSNLGRPEPIQEQCELISAFIPTLIMLVEDIFTLSKDTNETLVETFVTTLLQLTTDFTVDPISVKSVLNYIQRSDRPSSLAQLQSIILSKLRVTGEEDNLFTETSPLNGKGRELLRAIEEE